MPTEPINIRSLQEKDVPQMYRAFKSAFFNYPVPFELSEEDFGKKFIEKLRINFRNSAGAFGQEALKAFVFTSISKYEGLLTAYNGGTGVIPEYRGRGITKQLYEYLIPRLKIEKVGQCILEVLMDNHPAIEVYQQIGFSISRNFKCYKLNPGNPVSMKDNEDIKILRVQSPDWKMYTKFFDYLPCYLDSQDLIDLNLGNEVVIEASLGDLTVGYAIFQHNSGRISQIAVSRDHRGIGIGSMLLRQVYKTSVNKVLTIINVLEDAEGIHEFLLRSGFENELNQYEMRMML